MGEELERFLTDFSAQWRGSNATRLLCYVLVGSVAIALLAASFADVTRPRIYIVREGEVVETKG